MAEDKGVMRPCLFGTDGLHHATISGLTMLDPPGWFNLIANSSDILISDMTMLVGKALEGKPAKNTDGWDTYRSSNVVIQNSRVVNTDGSSSYPQSRTPLTNRLRLRLLQTKLDRHHRPKPRLHRLARNLRRESWTIPGRNRPRRRHLRVQRDHDQRDGRRADQGLAGCCPGHDGVE
jgi:hypothetical protein